MVTSAANRSWPGDVAVSDLAAAGLPAPSVVRSAKIATIEDRAQVRIALRGSCTSFAQARSHDPGAIGVEEAWAMRYIASDRLSWKAG